MTAPTDDVARLLQSYAKTYHAGAFATPMRSELETRPELITENSRYGDQHAIVIARRLTRDSVRTDFTGNTFTLPKGAYIATHIAHSEYLLPNTAPYDFVTAYAEDRELGAVLRADGRRPWAYRVSAAAEVITIWGPRHAGSPHTTASWDRATVLDFGKAVASDSMLGERMLAEVATVSGWDDDFPYYSDGSWSSVSLRGFWPDDPARGVKPAEMPKSWKLANREALSNRCDWTVLCKELPALTQWVQTMPWGWETERVRLLKMGRGKLGRHTDITDRATGTRDGQIARFHIPLITDPAIKLTTWDFDGRRRVDHLAAGRMYYLDTRKPHAVENPTDVERVHLVVDVVMRSDIRQRIADAQMARVLR